MEVKAMTCRRLALALTSCALLVACGGGGDGGGGTPTQPPPPGDGSVVTVNLTEFDFSPRQVTIEPGQTVRWVMRGNDPSHTVTARDGAFDSGFAFDSAGATFEHTFTAADDGETFEYACVSHQDCCDMKGSVRVGEDAPAPDPGY